MNWRSVEDKKPTTGKPIIVSDGNRSMEAYINKDGVFCKDGYYLKAVNYYPKAWMPMPVWEVEK